MSHEDERLASSLRELAERGLEPERDLWPELQRRIVAAKGTRRPIWYYAAAASVFVGSVAGILWILGQPHSASGLELLLSSRSPAQVSPASTADFQQAFRRYLDERERILGLVAEQLRDYPPEVREQIRRSMEVIERAMADIEASVAASAPDPAAEARLVKLYELELRLVGVVNERLRGSTGGGV